MLTKIMNTKFEVGDFVPWFRTASNVNIGFNFHTLGGMPFVLFFLPSTKHANAKKMMDEYLAGFADFQKAGGIVCGVGIDPADQPDFTRENLPMNFILFWDVDQEISQIYGFTPKDKQVKPTDGRLKLKSYVIDQNLRVFGVIENQNPTAHVQDALALMQKVPMFKPPAPQPPVAPVLIIPRVFEQDLCDHLVGLYKKYGGEASGFMVQEGDKTVRKFNPSHKVRDDYIIEDETLIQDMQKILFRRVAYEVEKAYQFKITRIERFIVAHYSAEDGGHFNSHRDNTTAGTAHRRFAMSLNLNDDYDGGYLRFPEYGNHLFKPPKGGACVFSCSLLHQATPIIKGERFVFVPFFYAEDDAKLRDENLKFLDMS